MASNPLPESRRLPAEWEPQQAIMLTWPHASGDFGPWLDEVEAAFIGMAREISRRERLIVVCRDAQHLRHVQKLLAAQGATMSAVDCHAVPSDDVWARDHGPVTVHHDDGRLLLDFRFNGWGGKYPYALDDRVTQHLHAAGAFGNVGLESIDMVLEGGSIETDGNGTLLTTSRCLLAPSRNPGLDRPATEARLRALLGVSRILWLEHGRLDGDDTDGHIDTLARFCDPHTICYQGCADTEDPQYAELQAMRQELRALRDINGDAYRLVELPLPAPRRDPRGDRLPAGYANFLIINDAVLVPVYDDPADALAIERLADCFAQHEIIPVHASALIRQYGSIHCLAMHIPARMPVPRPNMG